MFLHRPTYPPELFAALAANKARQAYETATKKLLRELRLRGVPEAEIEMMMSVPSDSVAHLRDNYPGQSPWMAEWLAAKCPQHHRPMGSNDIVGTVMIRTAEQIKCESDTIDVERRHTQRSEQNLSPKPTKSKIEQ